MTKEDESFKMEKKLPRKTLESTAELGQQVRVHIRKKDPLENSIFEGK